MNEIPLKENEEADPQGETFTTSITEEMAGGRFDSILAAATGSLSRSRVKALIKSGHATINGAKICEPDTRVNISDEIMLNLPEAEEAIPQPENIPLSIAHEDEHLIVVDKPAGLVVHPAAGNWNGTLVNAMLHHCADTLSGIGGVKRPGIVHRLDKDTSGLLVIAKSDAAHKGLAAQFADHGRTGPLERAYKALIWGMPTRRKGVVDEPIGRSEKNRLKMAIRPNGKAARTHYEVCRTAQDQLGAILFSEIECRLETGRTHQIRVHMAHLKCPVICDHDYGSGHKSRIRRIQTPLQPHFKPLKRQALHAAILGFAHPITGETMRFESPLPSDMAGIAEAFFQG